MSHRVLIGTLAGGLLLGVSATGAEAWHQRNYGYGSYYYYPPPPPPPPYYDEDFNQGYYDPYYEPPRKMKPKKKLSKKKRLELQKEAAKAKRLQQKKTAAKKKTAEEKKAAAVETPAVKTAKPETTSDTTEQTALQTPEQTASVSKPVKAKATAAVSCEKAGTILSSYGFSGIKASDCTGEEYTFDAARDGKAYAIKLNSASGELTEVRKVR